MVTKMAVRDISLKTVPLFSEVGYTRYDVQAKINNAVFNIFN
jgi:hypothetical protein